MSQQGVLTKSRSKPRNILRGIVPTANATWGTPPSNLANCTDGDLTTATGAGVKTTSGAAEIGAIIFNMGSIKTALVTARIGVSSDSSAVEQWAYIEESIDGTNFKPTYIKASGVASTSEYIFNINPYIVSTQYFRVRFYAAAAGTFNVKIYGVKAYLLE